MAKKPIKSQTQYDESDFINEFSRNRKLPAQSALAAKCINLTSLNGAKGGRLSASK